MADDNGFDRLFLEDGTITFLDSAIRSGAAFTRFSGEWGFGFKGDHIGGIDSRPDYYLIQAVPIPASVWLFGSALPGLLGIAWRRKTA